MLNKLEKKSILFYLASFFLPLVIIMVALVSLRVTPFGDKTLLISDAKALYVEYLSYSSRLFQGMEGFLYSFEKGLGGNMMPHIGGTMIHPVFAIMTLFNISNYPIAFTFVSVINFCICGLTMYILLADLFGHKRSNLIFSTTYALSGFLVANVFQVLFFTGCQALPLMVMGLRKIFNRKNPLLYICSIIYATVTSFYFGFILCVFSLVLFLVLLWLKRDELMGQKMSLFLNYGISSLCAGLIPMLIWLPAYMGIMGGRASQTRITDFSFWEKMPFIEIFSKLFIGTNNFSQLVDGLPNIYVGLLPVVLVILFYMNKKISKRMKAATAIVLGFYLLGFYIIAFDMLLNGGTSTNWFNFRYSFIFSFVLLVIASYEWQYIDEISFKELKYCFIGLIIAIVLIFSKKYEYVMGSEMLLDVGLLLVIFLAYRLYRLKPEFNPKHTFEAVTILIVSFSLFLNYTICTKNILGDMTDSKFRQTVDAVDPLVSALKDADNGFYRMEVNHQLSQSCGNDPMLYGYNGVGHGGSNERNFVREELFKLGVQWYNMRNYYSQGIPAATDSLLGLRYLIADEDMVEEKDYVRITDMKKMGFDFGDAVVYDAFKNPYALPIGFVSNNGVNKIELTDDDLFDNLNRVWSAISGNNQLVFIEEDDISFKSMNLADSITMEADDARAIVRKYESMSDDSNASNSSVKSDNSSTSNEVKSSSSSSLSGDGTETEIIMDEAPMTTSSIKFSFNAAQDGPVYVYHRGAFVKGDGNAESLVKYLGYYQKGEKVTGYLMVPGDYVNRITFEEYAGRFRAAYADLGTLEELSKIITERPSTLDKIKDSHLKGTMTLEKGQELLFTIPWDTGWTCYVDGKKTKLTKVLGVFMAAEVEPGEHTYEMIYEPAGFSLGIKISIATLLILILYMLFGRKWINKRFIKNDVKIGEEDSQETITTETDTNDSISKETDAEDSVSDNMMVPLAPDRDF